MNAGWMGCMRELRFYLSVVGADREESGAYRLEGAVSAFMGDTSENADVVVGADATYFTKGEPKNLAAGLRGTSYGLAVAVF